MVRKKPVRKGNQKNPKIKVFEGQILVRQKQLFLTIAEINSSYYLLDMFI